MAEKKPIAAPPHGSPAPYPLGWLGRVTTACLAPGPISGGKVAPFAFMLATAALATVVLWLGPYPVTVYPLDTMYMLVQGDYLLRGERPYVDYYSMHGPAPFVFSALGVWWKGVSLEAVVLAQVLGAAFFGSLAFVASRNRVHGALGVAIALCIEMLLVSCSPVGEKSWREFSCAMWYNSVGYSLYAIVFLHLLAPSRGAGRNWRTLEAAIMAFAMACAFCTKVTFCAPMVVLYAFGELLFPRQRADRLYALGSLTLAGVLVFAFIGVLGGSISGYLAFLDGMTFRVSPMLLSLRYLHYTRTAGVFFVAVLAALWLAHDAGLLRKCWREFLLVLPMMASLMLSASTASQDQEVLPFLGIIPLGVAITIGVAARRAGVGLNPQLAVGVLCLASLLMVHAPKNGGLSLAMSHARVPTLHKIVERGERVTTGISPRTNPSLFEFMPSGWSQRNRLALELLEEHAPGTDAKVFVAADTSAIPMLSGRPYADGQVVWWPLVFAKDPREFPLLKPDLLADTDWLLRSLSNDRVWTYLNHYRGTYLEENFKLVGEAEGWELYGRTAVSRTLANEPNGEEDDADSKSGTRADDPAGDGPASDPR